MKSRLALLACLALATANAQACSVCFQGGNSRTAYLATTFALASLPLLMVGGVVCFMRRRVKALSCLIEHMPGEMSERLNEARSSPAPR